MKILDHGFVELIDHMGNDLTVVNSARVSFGQRKHILEVKDHKLIQYLAVNKHWSPFRHVQFQFHCKVPEFVARQWYKHVVGIAYSDHATVDHAWNEISMRYVDASEFDFYVPDTFRKQSSDNKQASEENNDPSWQTWQWTFKQGFIQNSLAAIKSYKLFIKEGVAKEQARGLLPLNIYTEFYWTVSLQAVVNFIKLRQHTHAQYEIQLYAEAVAECIKPIVSVSYKYLMENNNERNN